MAVRPTAQAAAGLVFGYLGPADYSAVVLRPLDGASMVLETRHLRPGKPVQTKRSAPVPWREGNWYDLTLTPGPRGVEVTSSSGERELLASAALRPGQVGLCAEGTGLVRFDDFAARAVALAVDDFSRPALGEGWEASGGKWSLDGRGTLLGAATDTQPLLRAADFCPEEVGVTPTADKGPAGVVLNWRGSSGYRLTVDGGAYVLARVTDGKAAVLSSGKSPAGAELST